MAIARFVVPLVLLAATVLAAPDTLAQEPSPRRIVLLHEEVGSRTFRAKFNAAFIETLRSANTHTVDVYEEAIETSDSPIAGQLALTREYLMNKYADRKVDVLVVVSVKALAFARENRALFGNPAIVAAVSRRGQMAEDDNITGLEGARWIAETIDLALAFRPRTKQVVVIDGIADNKGDLQAETERYWSTKKGPFDLVYLRDLQIHDVVARVAALPEDAVVLYIRQTIRNPSQNIDPFEALSMVTRASRVPVFSHMGEYLGHGIVGGSAWRFEEDARRMAAMASQLASGRTVRDVRPAQLTFRPLLDWRQLQRWNISASQIPQDAEIRFKDPTAWDRYRWYIVGAIAIVAFQGLTIAALVIQRSRRREAQARNVAILQAIPDVMCLLDRNGVYVDLYAPEDRKEGAPLDPASVIGRRMRDVLPRTVADAFEHAFLRVKAGESPVVIEYAVRLPQAERQYEARMVPCGSDEILAVVRDVTDRKQAEQALNRTQADLARVSRLTALGEFAASIGHEVRQPLTAVLLNARTSLRWLSERAPDLSQIRAALLDIIDAGQRADDVITRNRELFRHQRVQKGPIDLNEIVHETAVLARQRLQANRVSLVTSLADGLPPADGDRVELQQVLLNLTSNAIDAMESVQPAERRIAITTSLARDGLLQVAVSDTGVGLAGVDTQQMFTISYTTKSRGSGVGLSVSRAIVDAHGGELWAEQNNGAGATFYFTIPVRSTIAAA